MARESHKHHRDFMRNNPGATKEEFIQATGGNAQHYYQARYQVGLSAGLARPRPELARPRPEADTSPSDSHREMHDIHKRIAELEGINNSLRVVISYLELQLGLKQSGSAI